MLAGRFVFANSDRGVISHHYLTIVDLSVGVMWPPKGMVGNENAARLHLNVAAWLL